MLSYYSSFLRFCPILIQGMLPALKKTPPGWYLVTLLSLFWQLRSSEKQRELNGITLSQLPKVSLTSELSKVRVLPTFPENCGPGTGKSSSRLDAMLNKMLHDLDLGNVLQVKESLRELKERLLPVSSKQSRQKGKGGVQYKPGYILNAVLLADNLRPLPANEIDFLGTVALQCLGRFLGGFLICCLYLNT